MQGKGNRISLCGNYHINHPRNASQPKNNARLKPRETCGCPPSTPLEWNLHPRKLESYCLTDGLLAPGNPKLDRIFRVVSKFMYSGCSFGHACSGNAFSDFNNRCFKRTAIKHIHFCIFGTATNRALSHIFFPEYSPHVSPSVTRTKADMSRSRRATTQLHKMRGGTSPNIRPLRYSTYPLKVLRWRNGKFRCPEPQP